MTLSVLLGVLLLAACSSAYTVSRNVKDYGATGNGVTDDSRAIITALTQGRGSGTYPSATYPDSTQTPAYVYFPAGTYLVTQTLPVVYYTQMIGDPANPPTIKFVNSGTVRVLEAFGGWYPGSTEGTDNFYRMIRNFVIDMTACNQCTGVHWQVAQATSITNVHFKCAQGSQCQGMWMENGSGGFFSDLVFEGGIYGLWVGNQQFTSRNITVSGASIAAVYINWDWVWTFKGLHVSNCPIGVVATSTIGSVVVIDSDFTNTPISVSNQFGVGPGGVSSLYLENVVYSGSGTIVQSRGSNVLTTTATKTVKGWAQGYIWQNNANALGTIDLSSQTPARPSSLVKADGTYFEQTRPTFVGLTQVDVTTLGLVGDGLTDNTAKLQSALNTYANTAVLFFPYGSYIISNTVVVPPGSRLLGQAWTILQASGSAFQNANSPIPMLQIGTAGQTGVAQLVDFMISTKGPQPGAKLIEWNLHDPANAPGSNGLWDVHYRIGGAVGTNIEPGNCPSGDGSAAPASSCTGAWALLHITSSGNAYLENVWGWVADHDIDQGAQINVYNSRGFLLESQGPTWGYGTAFEHSVLYQYNINNAKNVFLGAVQTETPYYQPSTLTPFNPSDATDPVYCSNDARCKMAYALALQKSSNVFIYGIGFYSFFNTWTTTCLPTSCQESMIYVSQSSNIYTYATNTYGAMDAISGAAYSNATNNPNWLLADGIVNLNLFGSSPTSAPTTAPTQKPTSAPTSASTTAPTQKPTSAPTSAPPTQPPSSNPPAVGYLQSKSNNLYVTLDGTGTLVATASASTSAAIFNFAPITGGYSIQAYASSLYVSADNQGASPLIANRGAPSTWETFVFSQPSSGFYAINAVDNSEFVAIQPSSGNQLLASVTVAVGATIPDTALFRIVTVAASPAPTASINVASASQIKLYSVSAKAFVTVNSGSLLVASVSSTVLASTFNVAAITGGFSLQNAGTSLYTSADNTGASPLIANRGAASGWETFNFVSQSGGTFSIVATDNSNLVAVQSDGSLLANVANSGTIPSSALFYVVAP